MINFKEYVAPSHWASALVNGDFTGLDDSESAKVKAFMEALPGPVVGMPEEIGFVWSTLWTDTPEETAGEYSKYMVDANV